MDSVAGSYRNCWTPSPSVGDGREGAGYDIVSGQLGRRLIKYGVQLIVEVNSSKSQLKRAKLSGITQKYV